MPICRYRPGRTPFRTFHTFAAAVKKAVLGRRNIGTGGRLDANLGYDGTNPDRLADRGDQAVGEPEGPETTDEGGMALGPGRCKPILLRYFLLPQR